MNYLRMWDIAASKRVDYFVAISHHVKQRIAKHYRRSADVIYPPVNTEFYTPDPTLPNAEFFLIVSAFAPYKKIELAIEAFNRLGQPLKIIGQGQELKRLKKLAKPNIELLGALPDEAVRDHYRRCRALIFPGEEDFGIVPLEAQACGTPVIGYARGGLLETTIPDQTAIYFYEHTPEALLEAIQKFQQTTFSPTAIRTQACRFAKSRFQQEMQAYIDHKMQAFAEETPWER
jgi:glycosyltransferase involved in cell wall biosynthesis